MSEEEIKPRGARVRAIPVNNDMIPLLFEQGIKYEILEGIPKDCRFRGLVQDPSRDQFVIFVEHPSFDFVETGKSAPHVTVRVKEISKLVLR